eukprot:COSAG06_NODE_2170_length_7417_cov_354.408172_5_plen_158_part_00
MPQNGDVKEEVRSVFDWEGVVDVIPRGAAVLRSGNPLCLACPSTARVFSVTPCEWRPVEQWLRIGVIPSREDQFRAGTFRVITIDTLLSGDSAHPREIPAYFRVTRELCVAGIVRSPVGYKPAGSSRARDVAVAAITGQRVVVVDHSPPIPVCLLHD